MLTKSDVFWFWAVRVVATLGVVVTVVAAVLTGPMLVHGQPAYVVLLGVVFALSVAAGIRSWRQRRPRHRPRRRHRVLQIVASLLGLVVLAAALWLVPSTAAQPAVGAMDSDSAVTVAEDAGQIVMTPTGSTSLTGLFFQPGAKVDARAYAAVLRPLAEAGFLVVVTKQPLGIAFLATGAFGSARTAHPGVTQWIVGGHSLGGTVAAIDASSYAGAAVEPVVGLLLFASYPATDLSALPARVLSVSGSDDGLATPEKIDASKGSLPADTTYDVVEGGIHAFFGDYGAQAGDGTAEVSHDEARAEITAASLAFLREVAAAG